MTRDTEVTDLTTHLEENDTDACLIRPIPHIEQDSSWDCGLACIQMILSSDSAVQLKQNLSSICPEEYQNKSTWTIDLCYLLAKFSVKVKYHTKTIGVNPSFTEERFYNNYIPKDKARVNQRFKDALSNGIDIDLSPLDLSDIILHLKQNGLAIVLTDAHQLGCITCTSTFNSIGSFVRGMFKAKLPFSGHYIVLCGYDIQKKLIYYKDPAVKSELCCLPYPEFEKARQAHGTDEDIILIYR